jgi:putative NADPH-quinone reductase
MNVLIVHAHNEPRSFNSALKNLAVDLLREQGNFDGSLYPKRVSLSAQQFES